MPAEHKTHSRLDLALAVLLCAGVFLFAHWQAFSNEYVINDDVRQQVYWMQQWRDPGLYRNDILTDYARRYTSWGVQAVYRAAAPFADPILFSKILSGFLFSALGGILFLLGRALGDRRLAWATLCAYLLSPFFLNRISGGLARAFAEPFLALYVLLWLRGRPWAMGACLALMALFIPYIALLAAGASLTAWGLGIVRLAPKQAFLRHPGHWLFLAAAGAVMYLFSAHLQQGGFGPLASVADMAGKPEFSNLGRYPVLSPAPLWSELLRPWRFLAAVESGGLLLGPPVALLLTVLSGYGLFRVPWRSLKPFLPLFLSLALASAILFFAAKILLLKLFVPSRYVRYSIALIVCLAMALGLRGALAKRFRSPAVAVAAVLLVAAISAARLQGEALKDFSLDAELYAAARETPKTALFAGHPYQMDNLATFGQRSVLVSFELAHPWSNGLWNTLKPRLNDFFAAYYARDMETVRAFCQKYRVDFLVVDDRHFTPAFLHNTYDRVPVCDALRMPGFLRSRCPGLGIQKTVAWPNEFQRTIPGPRPFFEPFGQTIRQLAPDHADFALLNQAVFPERRVNEHIRILDVRTP